MDSNKSANLQIDPEGGIESRVQNRVIAPVFLSLLAGRAFDSDENQTFNHALASNGLGLAGRIVGMAISSRNVAAGIGFYGAALSFYDLWLARGHDVVFAKETRIEVTTHATDQSVKVIRSPLVNSKKTLADTYREAPDRSRPDYFWPAALRDRCE